MNSDTALQTTTPISARPLRLNTQSADFEQAFVKRLHWSASTDQAIEERVAGILSDVQSRGDAAVLEYTHTFDRLSAKSVAELCIAPELLKQAFDAIPKSQRDSLIQAENRVRTYHQAQKKASGESWS